MKKIKLEKLWSNFGALFVTKIQIPLNYLRSLIFKRGRGSKPPPIQRSPFTFIQECIISL
ncbi:hypothetical protein V3C99_006569 [Haemonchus contortus]|uniref:Ovule protein n=1 Tax=Haemonchus contortus TaxID=6289 RepID=A0A7I4YT44_HAECO